MKLSSTSTRAGGGAMSSAEVRIGSLTADFGRTAADYGRYLAGFPARFFDRLREAGLARAGMRALDLGDRHRHDRARPCAAWMRLRGARSVAALDGGGGAA